MDATLGGEGSAGRRTHPRPSAFPTRSGCALGKPIRLNIVSPSVRRRRSEFPASREFFSAAVGAAFQKVLQCHSVVGFTTCRLQAGSGEEQGISDDRNRSLSGAFGAEQGKNRRAKTGREIRRGRVVRRGQDCLPQPGGCPCEGSDESAPRRSCKNHLALVHRFLETSRLRPVPLASEMLGRNRQDMIRILETLHELDAFPGRPCTAVDLTKADIASRLPIGRNGGKPTYGTGRAIGQSRTQSDPITRVEETRR